MIRRRLQNLVERRKCTLLGIGPMSKNCTDAAIELANEHDVPLMLIASRRQVDCEHFGGGYVNNWTTAQFAEYVISRDIKGRCILARDHGGPWQNDQEKAQRLSLRRAMESAKLSYRRDIDAGFDILHIDPSVDPHSSPRVDEILERIYELYEYCWAYAQRQGREVHFEIGTEEQSGSTNTPEELEYTLVNISNFCRSNGLPLPIFVVVQTGTRVMEMRNVGSFDSPIRVADELAAEIQVPMMIDICRRHAMMMKEHNTDYLSDEALRWHPRLGIHSANVAPEFGVAETRALLDVLMSNGLGHLAEEFVHLALTSGKWKKWVIEGSGIGDREKATICGHYIFSTPECIELTRKAALHLEKSFINLDDVLKNAVKHSILRYMRNFRLSGVSS